MYFKGDKVIATEALLEHGIAIGDVFEVVSVSNVEDEPVIGVKNEKGVSYVSDVFLRDIDVTEPMDMGDAVHNPSHYTDGGIEVIDYIEAKLTPEQFEGFLLGNVLKYTSRAGKKVNKVQDLEKAQVYLGWLVERCQEGQNK